MTLDDIRKLKAELEHRILAVTKEAISEFQARCDVQVNSVGIHLLHVHVIGEDIGKAVVKDCRIGVEL